MSAVEEIVLPTPLVSVILPTRDRLELLRRAVESVRAQTEGQFELIVVDDASSDDTPAFLQQLAVADPRVRIVRNTLPLGGGGARNAGIKLSRAQWVAFIDDDDEWLPHKLERQLQTLRSNGAVVACSCGYLVRSTSGASKIIAVRADTTVQDLLTNNWLGGASTCVCSSEALRNIGGFDPRLRAGQDLDLWVRLRQQGAVAVCTETLVIHRAHAGPRITTDTQSQYLGVRRFYFKHRDLMIAATRRHRLSCCCFVMSTQSARPLRRRVRLLFMAVTNTSPRYSASFVKRSIYLLLRDVLAQGLAALKPAWAARE
jgi:glycosyltransferase involved in cell wall biosynthesis